MEDKSRENDRRDRSSPRALLINGTVGGGKTSAAEAVGDVLTQARVPNAVIDMDCLRRAWSSPPGDRFNMGLALRNLTSVSANCIEAGSTSLVLAGVVEERSDRDDYEKALGIPLVLCRLRVDLALVRDRLIRRHADEDDVLQWHLNRSLELDAILESASVDDYSIDVTGMTLVETALAVVRAVGWT